MSRSETTFPKWRGGMLLRPSILESSATLGGTPGIMIRPRGPMSQAYYCPPLHVCARGHEGRELEIDFRRRTFAGGLWPPALNAFFRGVHARDPSGPRDSAAR